MFSRFFNPKTIVTIGFTVRHAIALSPPKKRLVSRLPVWYNENYVNRIFVSMGQVDDEKTVDMHRERLVCPVVCSAGFLYGLGAARYRTGLSG
jgi:hypothetical protein